MSRRKHLQSAKKLVRRQLLGKKLLRPRKTKRKRPLKKKKMAPSFLTTQTTSTGSPKVMMTRLTMTSTAMIQRTSCQERTMNSTWRPTSSGGPKTQTRKEDLDLKMRQTTLAPNSKKMTTTMTRTTTDW